MRGLLSKFNEFSPNFVLLSINVQFEIKDQQGTRCISPPCVICINSQLGHMLIKQFCFKIQFKASTMNGKLFRSKVYKDQTDILYILLLNERIKLFFNYANIYLFE